MTNKIYTYKGYKLYEEDDGIIIERIDNEDDYDYVDKEEIPSELIKFSSVRRAIYCAHVNIGGDMWGDTICRILRDSAPFDQLYKIEEIMNRYDLSVFDC